VLGSAQAELRPSGLLRWRYGDSRAGDYLEAWLQHLVLCADSATPAARHTRWLSADGEFAFDACDDALAQLAALLGLYRRGLSEALHFYPRTAWQWVRHGRGKALAAWRSTRDRPFGEDADPAYGLALRGVDNALDGAFEALAQQVFGPLLSHLRDARVAP
jgi:exodeoxyribonuclease V gamma subunit